MDFEYLLPFYLKNMLHYSLIYLKEDGMYM